MKLGSEKKITPEDDKQPDNWAEFWAKMLELVHSSKLQFKKRNDDHLCADEHFLSVQIKSVDWYDKKGQRHTFTTYHELPSPDEVDRVVAKVRHIELEYIPAQSGKNAIVQASGHQYDVRSSDFEEAHNAMMEKALSAISLAYMAKADGWEEVNFDQTEDPIDRYMLMLACDRLGIGYGDEGVYVSNIDGVTVKSEEEYESSPYIKATIAEIKKKGHDPDESDLIASAAQMAFESYLESRPPVHPKNRNSYTEKPVTRNRQAPRPQPKPSHSPMSASEALGGM